MKVRLFVPPMNKVWLLVPLGYLVFVFEERELIDRFGEEYRKYQREVPPFIPRWRRRKTISAARCGWPPITAARRSIWG